MEKLAALPAAAMDVLVHVAGKVKNVTSYDHGDLIYNSTAQSVVKNISSQVLSEAAALPANPAPLSISESSGWFKTAFSLDNIKSVGGAFTYLTSKWALGCFLTSMVLNRVLIYATTRQRIRFSWRWKLAIRIVPILLLIREAIDLLQVIHCQTSPNYRKIRSGADYEEWIDFSGEGGFIYRLSSTLLLFQRARDSCSASNMIIKDGDDLSGRGSLSRLWHMFLVLCLNHLVESVSCALQGQQVEVEAGMSVFEHSMAFAEAETSVGNLFGLGTSVPLKPGDLSKLLKAMNVVKKSSVTFVPKTRVFYMLNTTPEVLLICLISCFQGLSSNILAVFGLQKRYRLINTGVWGISYIACFIWGFTNYSDVNLHTWGIFRMPTICFLGFSPHIVMLVGIVACAVIYGVALFFSALSAPRDVAENASLRERVQWAHTNLQASIYVDSINIDLREDFYSAILRIGIAVMTTASDAAFLNEGISVAAPRLTWLEDERIQELRRGDLGSSNFNEKPSYGSARYILAAPSSFPGPLRPPLRGGFATEKKTRDLRNDARSSPRNIHEPRINTAGRHILAIRYYRDLFKLFAFLIVSIVDKILNKLGVVWRPAWVRMFAEKPKPVARKYNNYGEGPGVLEFWLLTDDGELTLPSNDDVDVEAETKKRLKMERKGWTAHDEAQLDKKLYQWWAHGGWWGTKDESGSYEPPPEAENEDDDDDARSELSESTEHEWETDTSDGDRTPKQSTHSHKFMFPRDVMNLNTREFSRMIDPDDPETRFDARILANHLRSDHIVTRTEFHRVLDVERMKVFKAAGYRVNDLAPEDLANFLTPGEESEFLEQLILVRRSSSAPSSSKDKAATWREGAEGLGTSGPQCAVCQTEPRTIIAWPCRCLSLCEDCRISLAMNNFGSCVCCRQQITGFVRIYVP